MILLVLCICLSSALFSMIYLSKIEGSFDHSQYIIGWFSGLYFFLSFKEKKKEKVSSEYLFRSYSKIWSNSMLIERWYHFHIMLNIWRKKIVYIFFFLFTESQENLQGLLKIKCNTFEKKQTKKLLLLWS